MVNFEKDVLAESYNIPVVVDFWAPWCGPCQFLGPMIEELAEEAGDKWKLIKINTDEHPDISQTYGIRSIPAVKMFHKGEIIAEFTGALPKPQITQWLDEHLPDPRKEKLQEILLKLNNSSPGQGLKELKDFVAKYPDVEEAKIYLAGEQVFQQPDAAQDLVKDIPYPMKN